MPTREMAHRQGGQPQACFCGVRDEQVSKSRSRVHDILRREFATWTPEAIEDEFDCFRAYVEIPHQYTRSSEEDTEQYPIPGRIGFRSVREIRDLLETKRLDEKKARKIEGHTSYEPQALLSTETYIVLIGSQSFLYWMLRLHMEELSEFREHLLDACGNLLELRPFCAEDRHERQYHAFRFFLSADCRGWLLYNMRWVAERVAPPSPPMSTSTLRARLGE